MKPVSPLIFWRTVLIVGLGLSLAAIVQVIQQFQSLQIVLWHSRWVIVLAGYALAAATSLVLLIWSGSAKAGKWVASLELHYPRASRWQYIGWVSLPVSVIAILFIKWQVFGKILPQFFPLFAILWWLSILSAAGIRIALRTGWAGGLAISLLVQGIAYRFISFLPAVSAYPLSLGWSETSRYYYASQYFSKQIYGFRIPWSPLHPTRYLLQSIPFLFGDPPLWFHRLWQVLLWVVLTGVTSLLLARRFRPQSRGLTLLAAAWAFLYMFQGVVYYHLQVCVIIILIGVWPRRPWVSALAVVAASIWAGMSRLNWFPVPAMLAIALYLLEEPIARTKNMVRYFLQPLLWTIIGLASALASQALFVAWSRNPDLSSFGSSLTSDLLWDRLLPNPTYPLGVIPGILLVSAPLLWALVSVRDGLRGCHWLRQLGLFLMLLVLFAGGLVVSTKIGGGGDLHNMDAYMVLLAIIAATAFLGRISPDVPSPDRERLTWPVLLASILIPLAFTLQDVNQPTGYNQKSAQRSLEQIQRLASQATSQGGEVLFINQRHLLTFGQIESIRLVPEYEVVTLMEMAMSHNTMYLDNFYADLHAHRFALIVTSPQNTGIKKGVAFAEENNAWNTAIARMLLCEYEPVMTDKDGNVQILAPRPTPVNCPTQQPQGNQ